MAAPRPLLSTMPARPRLLVGRGSLPRQPPMRSQLSELTPEVRQYLAKVYGTLGLGILSFGLSSLVGISSHFPPLLAALVGLGLIVRISMWRDPPTTRMAMFAAFTVFSGLGAWPIVAVGLAKGIVLPALMATVGIFGGFTAAALLAPSRTLLCLGGPLMGGLIVLMLLSLASIFFPSPMLGGALLWGMLALFSAFVAFDTQAAIHNAQCGAHDVVGDALNFFISFINIFKTILMISGRD